MRRVKTGHILYQIIAQHMHSVKPRLCSSAVLDMLQTLMLFFLIDRLGLSKDMPNRERVAVPWGYAYV